MNPKRIERREQSDHKTVVASDILQTQNKGQLVEKNDEKKEKAKSKKKVTKIHKIYLVVALIIGITFSVFMPFFNEPDGQYHYVISSNIVGITNDVTHYGETYTFYGDQYQHEVPYYKTGSFFEHYFVRKISRISMTEEKRAGYVPQVFSYNYFGHLIPAAGLWLGYQIYPSMGVMIVMGRLLSMFVCTLIMYFIIKRLRHGKLLFAAVSLLPVTINLFSSLSYDATGFVLSALIVATTINALADRKVTLVLITRMLLLSAVSFVAIKTNFLLLLLLFPLVICSIFWQNWSKRENFKAWLKKYRLVFFILSLFIFAFVIAAVIDYSVADGGFGRVIYRLFINQFYVFDTSYSVVASTLVQPLGLNNSLMPTWTVGLWFFILGLAAFSENGFVKTRLMSAGAFVIFLLNILAVYLSFLTYPVSPNNSGIMGQITGVQGRYFTPTLLLFAIIAGNSRLKLRVTGQKSLQIALIIVALVTNATLLFNTLFTIYNMS